MALLVEEGLFDRLKAEAVKVLNMLRMERKIDTTALLVSSDEIAGRIVIALLEVLKPKDLERIVPTAAPEEQVNHPNHYTVGGIETIDFVRAKLTPEQFEGYLLGTQLVYLARANWKGQKEQDIKKANVYGRWLEEVKKP